MLWSPSAVNYATAIGNYSVTYRMRGGNGDKTVYTSSTSVTLQDLDPSAEYDVQVAAIDLCGRMSDPSMVAQLDLQGTQFIMRAYNITCAFKLDSGPI